MYIVRIKKGTIGFLLLKEVQVIELSPIKTHDF